VQDYVTAPGVDDAVAKFLLPETLGFGQVPAPLMFSAQWRDGQWSRGLLEPYAPIQIEPGARALHYAEVVFEGMKAYAVNGAAPNLFRPRENWLRLSRSANRLSMPMVPETLFFQGLDALVKRCRPAIPAESGRALYLRPFIFGTEPGYHLRNSTQFRFMIIANPVEAYASGPMRVAIERCDVRAAVGGVGATKTAANYAPSLRASTAAATRGLNVALWLDAREQRYVQELSGMNFFAVIDGELHTPELDGAILPGVTRDSLLALGTHLGYRVHERRMALDELIAQLEAGRCSELFACGTGAIVCPIAELVERDQRSFKPREVGKIAAHLRDALLAIQESRASDPFGWTRAIPGT
jgi:branched-chain amino acid aminotransferase